MKNWSREELSELAWRWLARLPLRAFRDPAPVVGVLRLSGVIGRIGPVGSGMTLAGLERTIKRAFSARNLKAVALAVNSPGGSAVQSAMIARRIRELAGEKNVPVVAFAEDVAASGGYWLACAADEIFADENSIIGSIGVISAGFGFPDLLERFGVERRVHTAGKRKGMLDPFRPEAPEDIARLHSIQADVHDSFKRMVRERRGDRLQAPDAELFEGDIWTGSQALSLGLVDGIGNLRTVMRERFGERVKLHEVSPRGNLLRRWLGRGAAHGPERQAWAVLAVLEEWATWKRFGQ
jgi:serine protease SohB